MDRLDCMYNVYVFRLFFDKFYLLLFCFGVLPILFIFQKSTFSLYLVKCSTIQQNVRWVCISQVRSVLKFDKFGTRKWYVRLRIAILYRKSQLLKMHVKAIIRPKWLYDLQYLLRSLLNYTTFFMFTKKFSFIRNCLYPIYSNITVDIHNLWGHFLVTRENSFVF